MSDPQGETDPDSLVEGNRVATAEDMESSAAEPAVAASVETEDDVDRAERHD